MKARKKRNGKQWSALLFASFLFLAGMGTFFKEATPLIASLLVIIFLIWIGALAFLAIGRAWAVGQDVLAFIGSILVILALAPLIATPVFGDGWLDTKQTTQERVEEKSAGQSSALNKAVADEVAVFKKLEETVVNFNLQKTPLLLRFYLLVLTSALIAVSGALLISRPSQKLPRAGAWAEKLSVWGLGVIFVLFLLLFSGVLAPSRVIDHLETVILLEAVLATLVAYYRWGVPPDAIIIAPPQPSARPSAEHKEALRKKGRAVRAAEPSVVGPTTLPDLDDVPLAPGPEEETKKPKSSAPPGSPGSLEPLPGKSKKTSPKERGAAQDTNEHPSPDAPSSNPAAPPKTPSDAPPQSPGWYPDPFSASGKRYWSGKRWGQQTRP